MELESRLKEILKREEFAAKSYASGSYKQAFKRKSRRIEEVVPGLLSLEEGEREEILRQGERVAQLDPEVGFFFFVSAPEALKQFHGERFSAWVEKGMEILKSEGMEEAKDYFKNITREAIEEISSKGLGFEKVRRILTLYVQSLSGYPLELEEGEVSTDTRRIFLPSDISLFASEEENFKVYKVMVAQSYGLIRYGSFNLDLGRMQGLVDRIKVEHGLNPRGDSDFERFFSLFPDPELALDIYSFLENRRVEERLRREFKGLARDIEGLREALGLEPVEGPVEQSPEASARATFKLYKKGVRFEFPLYWGRLSLKAISQGLKKTGEELEEATRELLRRLGEDAQEKIGLGEGHDIFEGLPKDIEEEISVERDEYTGEGEVDGRLLVKVLEDTGRKLRAGINAPETELQVELTGEDMAGAYIYDEWDYKLNKYRASWCALREKEVKEGSPRFVENTLRKYGSQVYLIRRQFEMLRPENRKVKRQREGEDVDIDTLVESYADMMAGITPSEELYTRLDKRERDIAVAFLVDLSGSTTGWVIETEKEALVLMCEGLEKLGDRYAIYGFSSRTRRQCDFYIIKEFEEPYGEEIKDRIAGIDALDYTRMGPAIRHVVKKLEEVEARTKIVMVMSDGKPEDFDEYKGDHGIEDTRKALVEAKRRGIRPFCITIDKEAKGYIQRLFGEVGYIIIDDVGKLPRKLPEIYKRLST
jgi:nitric oxide reductase NorD protein